MRDSLSLSRQEFREVHINMCTPPPLLTQTLNVFITMVGAGIVSLPLAMRASTLFVGCGTLLFAAVSCCLSMHVCVWLARRQLFQPNAKLAPLLNKSVAATCAIVILEREDVSDNDDSIVRGGTSATTTTTSHISTTRVLKSYDEIISTYLPSWGSTIGNVTIVVLLLFVLALFVDVAHDSVTATAEIMGCMNGYPLRAGKFFEETRTHS